MSDSRLTAVAVPEGTGQGVGPTVQCLAGAGEGSTVLGEGSTVLGEGIGREVGTGHQGTDRRGIGRQVAGTGEAAHLDLWTI